MSRCAALTKDEDFNAREFYLNCLEYAARCAWDMESCVVGAGSRRLVEQFFSKCEDAASGTFWIRIKTLIDALGELLFKCNNETGDPIPPKSQPSHAFR